jgi:hypothetical protein
MTESAADADGAGRCRGRRIWSCLKNNAKKGFNGSVGVYNLETGSRMENPEEKRSWQNFQAKIQETPLPPTRY